MAKRIRMGDTPIDWYVSKFGDQSAYRMDSFGEVQSRLRFKKSAKKKKPKKKPSKAITMYKYTTIFLTESGWMDISRHIPLSRVKKLFPTCKEVMYSNDLNTYSNFSVL
jgi:hypothetical protein